MSTETSPPVAPLPTPSAAEPRLRLWPGVVLLALFWLIRAAINIVPGSPSVFFFGYMIAPFAILAALVLWWLLASRLPWRDRLLVMGSFVIVTATVAVTSRVNFPAMALMFYALPALISLWVGWLLATIWLSWPVRKYGLLAIFLLTGAAISVLRVDGMDGSFNAAFSWRWKPTAEERMLAELSLPKTEPTVQPTATSAPAAEKMSLQPGDWPGFRGAARDGRLAGVRVATDWEKSPPREVWRRRVGPGWSSFAVIGDRIYTQEQRGADELVVCYDANTGAEIWVHSNPTRFEEVVAGAGPRATPTFDDGWIYSLGANGQLDCLDAATGERRWTRDIVADSEAKIPNWGFSGSPLVADGIVSVFAGGPKDKSVLGYRAEDGELAWSAGEGSLSYCSTELVRLGGVEQLLIATDAGLTAFQPVTGEVLWNHAWPSDGVPRIVQPALLNDTDLLIGTGMNVGSRRITVGHESDTWPITELWTSRTIKPYYNDLVVYQDSLYGFDGAIFMCVSLDDGRAHWKARGYGAGQVLLLVDQGLLLILSEQGEVALVEATPEKHREATRFKAIDGKTWNHPVIAHGKLFVRNAEEAACFELTPLADDQAQAAR